MKPFQAEGWAATATPREVAEQFYPLLVHGIVKERNAIVEKLVERGKGTDNQELLSVISIGGFDEKRVSKLAERPYDQTVIKEVTDELLKELGYD